MTNPDPAVTDEQLIDIYSAGFGSGAMSILLGIGWHPDAAQAQCWQARQVLRTDPIQRDMVARHARAILNGKPLPYECANVAPETQERVHREWHAVRDAEQ